MASRIYRLLTQLAACLVVACVCVFAAELRLDINEPQMGLNTDTHKEYNKDTIHRNVHNLGTVNTDSEQMHAQLHRGSRDTLIERVDDRDSDRENAIKNKEAELTGSGLNAHADLRGRDGEGVIEQNIHSRHNHGTDEKKIVQEELDVLDNDGGFVRGRRDQDVDTGDGTKKRNRDVKDDNGVDHILVEHSKKHVSMDGKQIGDKDIPVGGADAHKKVEGGIADALLAAKAQALGEKAVRVENELEVDGHVNVLFADSGANRNQDEVVEGNGKEGIERDLAIEGDVMDGDVVVEGLGSKYNGLANKVHADSGNTEKGGVIEDDKGGKAHADGLGQDVNGPKVLAEQLALEKAAQREEKKNADNIKAKVNKQSKNMHVDMYNNADAADEDYDESDGDSHYNDDNNSETADEDEDEEESQGEGQERYLEPILPEHHALVGLGKHGYTSVDDYGAVADGVTLNTDAINLAIGAVNAMGGGTVVFPGPGVYLTSTIFMMSDIRVLIENGTTVMSTTEPSLWPTIRHRFGVLMCGGQMGRYYQRKFVGGPLFFCHLCNNITMAGKGGVVDGQGGHWWDRKQGKGLYRGYLAMFINSTNIHITDLTFQNSAAWNIVPKYCTNVTIDRVSIYNHYVKGHNTDGVNPYSSKNVNITNTVIVTGDDCIAVKSGPRPSCGIPSENILVNNVTCVGSHGLTIGSEMNAGVQNVVFSNVTIDGRNTPSSQGIRLKSVRGRGGFVRNILYENIRIHNVKIGIQVTLNYRDVDPSVMPVPHFSNITVRNVYGTKIHREIGTFDGLPDAPIDGVSLENVFLFASANAKGLQCSQTINAKFNRAFPPPDMTGSCVQDRWGVLLEALGWSYGLFSWPRWLSTRMFFWLL
ncbi:hypothetical protein SARC_12010 [Sphaeroforma arctica JP610]|uniref:Pectate lyase superfamily protein domain-containing protein n=1 Tax=Sphaeroforma arctica JP610 TaxID=667725 RepID=A0A0L0FFB4_9EUKA|nr:hypothetical protein SARC_12010 [Sphaeroforma arctica JP610]KNC75464.1 hypothetical protein SARC_12010 [Sphaeroforma arctica JP610]|eukprot:XP_014149366.1 hypothetical protein SARC_12010 [Sphaeroforma arctica JP610]